MKSLLAYILGLTVPFLVFVCFLLADIQVDGVLEGELLPGVRNPYMYHPLPDVRIKEGQWNGRDVYTMTGEPAYVSLRLPKTRYDRVTIGVEFLPVHQSVFEIGPESKPGSQSFDLKPLYQEAIEKLSWPSRRIEGGTVYERPGFENKDHARDRVATYAYNVTEPYRDSAYAPRADREAYELDLRGSHTMKTYIKNEDLDMIFTLTDMNRELGRDDVVISVRDEEGRLVREIRQDDDGNERMDQDVTRYDIPVHIQDLPEGVYEVSLNTTSDVFLRTLDTTQTKFVFVNRLYVGDAVGWREAPARTDFYGNGQAYTLLTLHNEGLQSVFFDDASVALAETHKNTQFILEKPKMRLHMRIPKGDVSVVSDGVFSLTPEQFFMPDPRVIGSFTDIESLGVDAVYTSYERRGYVDWQYAEQTFDATQWWDDGYGSMRFALSAPFIATREGAVQIARVTVRFEKTPIRSVRAFWEALRERIPFGI